MRKLIVVSSLIVAGCSDGTGPGSGTLPNTGGVVEVAASDSIVRVGGGSSGAEYVLVPFFGASASTLPAQLTFIGSGTSAVAAEPLTLASAGAVTPGRLSLSRAGSDGASLPLRDAAFDVALRRRERRELSSRFAAARASANASTAGPRLARAIVPSEGATLSLNVDTDNACSLPDYRTGRIVAVSTRAVIVADADNPAGGFTDAEYRDIAAAFDTLVYPVETRNFGTPSDIDDNGTRSLIFFTRAVNALTARNSDAYVGGFFFGRDLFPTAECAGSNRAEMFYMLVPDPSGAVNGNVRTKDFVRNVTVGVLGHEFQHLINVGRRLYVNDANEYEDVWLDEGLSHVAEELLFYQAAGRSARANIGATTLRSSAAAVAAFNSYQSSNYGRLSDYLSNPEGNAPYASDDSLATRGATWQYLRYAADQKGGDEAATWTALANSRVAGLANLTAVLGGDALGSMRRWAVAQYADDEITGAAGEYQQPSWDYRDIFSVLSSGSVPASGSFPLLTRLLPVATALPLTLAPGGAGYVRFAVPANATAEVRVSSPGRPLPAGLVLTVLRTK